jgi:hypothetical protein
MGTGPSEHSNFLLRGRAMGIRFLCPNGHKLNVKAELAGRRGSCPECGAKLVIPAASALPKPPNNEPPLAAGKQNVAESHAAAWHLRTAGGEQHGPVSELQFRAWIAAGRVAADSLVKCEGWPEWKPARDVAELLPTPLVAKPAISATSTSPPEPPKPTDPMELDARPAADTSAVAEEPAVDSAEIDPAEIETDATKSPALAASTYVYQRKRSKQKQLTLAIVMLLAVVVLAGVLIWVVNLSAGASTDTLSRLVNPQSPLTATG